MFDKIKQMMEMRQEAAKLQTMLEAERIEHTGAHGKIKVIMNGKNEIIELTIHPDLMSDKAYLERLIKDTVNDAIKTVQKQMAKKMAQFM